MLITQHPTKVSLFSKLQIQTNQKQDLRLSQDIMERSWYSIQVDFRLQLLGLISTFQYLLLLFFLILRLTFYYFYYYVITFSPHQNSIAL